MPDLVAIIATLSGFLIGASGLYLTYRSRTSALREQLHAQQITFLLDTMDILVEVEELTQRLKRSLAVEAEPPDDVRDSLRPLARDLEKKAHQGMVVLPPSTSFRLALYADEVNSLIEKPIEPSEQWGKFTELHKKYISFLSAMRKELGTTELSNEMLALLK